MSTDFSTGLVSPLTSKDYHHFYPTSHLFYSDMKSEDMFGQAHNGSGLLLPPPPPYQRPGSPSGSDLSTPYSSPVASPVPSPGPSPLHSPISYSPSHSPCSSPQPIRPNTGKPHPFLKLLITSLPLQVQALFSCGNFCWNC